MNKKVNWIASYPKSGRTWFKILLESILLSEGEGVDINKLKLAESFTPSRQKLDQAYGIPSSELHLDEIWQLEKQLLNQTYGQLEQEKFVLTHGANSVYNNSRLYGEEISLRGILLMRNPLAVVCSMASFLNISIDESINRLNGFHFANDQNITPSTTIVKKKEIGWSKHYQSWFEVREYPIHTIRYEDMVVNPLNTLNNCLKFLNKPTEIRIIQNAIANNSFEKLKEKEKSIGFNETPATAKNFFRKGKIDSWKAELSEQQIDQIIKHNYKLMKKLDYLP